MLHPSTLGSLLDRQGQGCHPIAEPPKDGIALLSTYDNGWSVKSVVGAAPLFDLVASGHTPPDSPTAGS
jgi:hypothetical protein